MTPLTRLLSVVSISLAVGGCSTLVYVGLPAEDAGEVDARDPSDAGVVPTPPDGGSPPTELEIELVPPGLRPPSASALAAASTATTTLFVWAHPSGMYGARVDAGGALLDPEGILVAPRDLAGPDPQVAVADDTFFVLWERDDRLFANTVSIADGRAGRAHEIEPPLDGARGRLTPSSSFDVCTAGTWPLFAASDVQSATASAGLVVGRLHLDSRGDIDVSSFVTLDAAPSAEPRPVVVEAHGDEAAVAWYGGGRAHTTLVTLVDSSFVIGPTVEHEASPENGRLSAITGGDALFAHAEAIDRVRMVDSATQRIAVPGDGDWLEFHASGAAVVATRASTGALGVARLSSVGPGITLAQLDLARGVAAMTVPAGHDALFVGAVDDARLALHRAALSDGAPIEPVDLPVTEPTRQLQPEIACLDDVCLAVWIENRDTAGPETYRVFGRRFDRRTAEMIDPAPVAVAPPLERVFGQNVCVAGGHAGFLVGWWEADPAVLGSARMRVRRLDESGALAEPIDVEHAARAAHGIGCARHGAGFAIAANVVVGSTAEVHVHRLDATGARLDASPAIVASPSAYLSVVAVHDQAWIVVGGESHTLALDAPRFESSVRDLVPEGSVYDVDSDGERVAISMTWPDDRAWLTVVDYRGEVLAHHVPLADPSVRVFGVQVMVAGSHVVVQHMEESRPDQGLASRISILDLGGSPIVTGEPALVGEEVAAAALLERHVLVLHRAQPRDGGFDSAHGDGSPDWADRPHLRARALPTPPIPVR